MTPAPSATDLRPTVLDLFSGAGGIALGFQQAGYRIVGGVDFSKHAIASFNANLPGANGLVRDLRKDDFSDIEELVGGEVDVIVGGPSCQGFSTSGGLSRASGRDETDPRNQLFVNYINIVDLLRPSWIVFENVPGLLLYDSGRVALDIARAFKEIGYTIVPMILLAADFGVPQLRRRLVFVGNRTGSDISFPAATNGNPELWKNFSLPFAHLSRIGHGQASEVSPHVSFADACGDLPAVAEGGCLDGIKYPGPPQTDYQRMIRDGSTLVRQHEAADLSKLDHLAAQLLEEGQNWRDLPADVLPPRFSKIRRYDATTLLKRLRSDKPAYTITTKFNEATTGAFIHPTQARTLTLREAARLQAFPDAFVFEGTAAQIRQQIGNAVPPLLARCVAEAIRPAVVKDAFGVTIPLERDVLTVDVQLEALDPLRLHGARRKTEDARQAAFV
jgi:DNA (cytosine-5)-methyltransferase 1